tara:strand:+ start:36 stop:656 length:621 start_codon:yes stop_codon:yes gene_type:complete
MASSAQYRGLIPARKNGSGSNSTGISTIDVIGVPSSILPENIYTGDPVFITTAGLIKVTVAPSLKSAGVFQGCSFVDSDGEQQYKRHWTGAVTASEVKLHITADPAQTYYCQSDTVVSSDVLGNRVRNVGFVVSSTKGNTTTGYSKIRFTAASITAAIANMRIIRRAEFDLDTSGAGTSATDAYPWYEVRLNNHFDNFTNTSVSVA